MSSPIKETALFVWEVIKIVALALIIVIPVRYFLFQPFVIQGSSMEPNFHDGDYLIVNELSKNLGPFVRGQVVVFKYPLDPSKRFIKRIIGLPGDTVQTKDNHVFIIKDGKTTQLDESKYIPASTRIPSFGPVTVPDGEYYVLGDNREFSSDSHEWGMLPRANIIGSVLFRLWPLNQLAKIEKPVYVPAP
jgi:signal peptidase I